MSGKGRKSLNYNGLNISIVFMKNFIPGHIAILANINFIIMTVPKNDLGEK